MSVDQSSTSGSRMSMRQESVLQVDDKNEYETQFFGFTPKSFVDGVYNAIFEYLRDGIELLEKYLVSEFEKDGVSKEIVREGSQKLLSHFRVRFDRACDKLEKYLMKNIFHIPSKMIQTCDVVNQENNYTESEEQLLDDEIQQLQIKIQNVKYTNAYLKQYIMDMEKVQNQLDNVLSKVESMAKICNQAGVSDMKESIIFIAGKVGRIQSKLNDVYSKQLDDTQTFEDDGDLDRKKLL